MSDDEIDAKGQELMTAAASPNCTSHDVAAFNAFLALPEVKRYAERRQREEQVKAERAQGSESAYGFAAGNDLALLGTAGFQGIEISAERGTREYDGKGNVIVTLPDADVE